MHFAAHTIVPESVALPLKYYGNNTCATRSLLQACIDNGVKNFRVFLDRGGVRHAGGRLCGRGFADPAHQRLRHLQAHERVDAAGCGGGQSAALCGAALFQRGRLDPGGRIGQATPGATLLTKVACEAMVGKRPHVSVFGSDYPDPDGTGVRDYLHVEDLAGAHLNALRICAAAAGP
jgi:UDP-glucose 4-epimerase